MPYRRYPPTVAVPLLLSLACPRQPKAISLQFAKLTKQFFFCDHRSMHYRAFGNMLELDRVQVSSIELIEDLIFEGTSHVNTRAHTFTRECFASALHSMFKLLLSGTVPVK